MQPVEARENSASSRQNPPLFAGSNEQARECVFADVDDDAKNRQIRRQIARAFWQRGGLAE
jgi:hypothetical protein